jgi:methyl-accepting chemotaxis protein
VDVRKATTEQTTATVQLTQATEAIRRGTVTTSRALEEQANASSQVAAAVGDLSRQIASVTRAMVEQTTTAGQVTTSTEAMKAQSDQVARASAEQTRTMKEMARAAASTAKDIKAITQANKTHSVGATRLVSQLAEIRRVTARNADGVRQTRGGTADLLKQAEMLTGLVDSAADPRSANGRGRAR